MNQLTQEVGHYLLNNPLILVLPGMPTRVREISGVVGGAKLNDAVRPSPVRLVPADGENLSVD